MASEIVTYGKLEAGELKLAQRQQFTQSLKSFKDGPIELIVRRWRSKRSDPQNAWYWACIVPMITDGINELQGEEAFSRDDVHEFLKQRFNTKTVLGEGDSEVRIARSTSQLTTTEFSAYVEKCRHFAAEMLGINIPDPEKDFDAKPRKRKPNNDVFVEGAYVM